MSIQTAKSSILPGVLVTGASGYLAIHCVRQLLEEGYTVRGTVRSKSNQQKIRPLMVLKGANERLELVEADLDKQNGWTSAISGCTYILHVASPFPIKADDSIIQTAINGTLTVLKAASQCPEVKKIVLTSSVAAVAEGFDFKANKHKTFNENDWTNVEDRSLLPYVKSKAMAEKAAWDYVKSLPSNNRYALTVINPAFIVGPLLIDVQGTSITAIKRMMNGEYPAVPHLQFGVIDVRDCADAHVRAMTNPQSDGQRFIMSAKSLWMIEIGKMLADEFGYKLPKHELPHAIFYLYSIFDDEAKQLRGYVGHELRLDNTKAKTILGINFRNPKDSILDMAYTLIERGIVPKTSKYRGAPTALMMNTMGQGEDTRL